MHIDTKQTTKELTATDRSFVRHFSAPDYSAFLFVRPRSTVHQIQPPSSSRCAEKRAVSASLRVLCGSYGSCDSCQNTDHRFPFRSSFLSVSICVHLWLLTFNRFFSFAALRDRFSCAFTFRTDPSPREAVMTFTILPPALRLLMRLHIRARWPNMLRGA